MSGSELCFVQSWSHGYNQHVLGGPAPVITMMRHHVLEAFFGYHSTKWKQPTSSNPAKTKHNFSFSKNGYCSRARRAKWSAWVARSCARRTVWPHLLWSLGSRRATSAPVPPGDEPRMVMTDVTPEDTETQCIIMHSQTGLCVPAWCCLCKKFDSLHLHLKQPIWIHDRLN